MSKRKTTEVLNEGSCAAKRPLLFHNINLSNTNDVIKPSNKSTATKVIHHILKLDLDVASPNLVQDLLDIVKAFEGILPLLHQTGRKKAEKIKNLIKRSLECLKSDINTIKDIKIKIVVFGALGLGKSYVLSHLLRHGMTDNFTLLPSGDGSSVTPIPVKIKHGPHMNISVNRKDKDCVSGSNELYLECFSDLDDAYSSTAEVISEILENRKEYQDAQWIDVTIPLPVFEHLSEFIKKKCTYKDINVELEIVDLPGLGDENGDSLIGKELYQADIIMFFKSSQSGRPMTVDDLANIFQRRKQFDYASRPTFVYLANEDKGEKTVRKLSSSEMKELRETRENELKTSWDNLMKCAVDGNADDCYNVVFERLPQTSSQNLLETLKKESKAVVFRRDDEDFVNHVGDIIAERANNVSIKRNAHPVISKIFTLTSKLMNLTTHLIRTHMNTNVDSQPSQTCFKPSQQLPFQMSLSLNGNFLRLLPHLKDLIKCSSMEEAHKELIKSLREECMVAHFLRELQGSLEKHWKKTMATSQDKNKLSFSEAGQSFVFLAEISCHDIVTQFFNDHIKVRAFILNSISRLADKAAPKKAVQAEWKTLDVEERESTLSDHCCHLVQELSQLLECGTREQSLHKILKTLHETCQNFIMAGVQLSDPDIKAEILRNIHEKLVQISNFTLKKLREVNPHSEQNRYLTTKMDYPEMKNLKTPNKPKTDSKIFQKLVAMLKDHGKGNPIIELQRKLNLTAGSLIVPDDMDEFQWARILLNVLYDPDFHHENFGNSGIDCSVKWPLNSIRKVHLDMAKRQLFAYQKSTATCEKVEDNSVVNDIIKIEFGGAGAGLTASMNTNLIDELNELRSLNDLKDDLAPIFIIPTNRDLSGEGVGNVYLENKELEAYQYDDDGGSGDTADVAANQATGLEDRKTTIFYVVAPGHLEQTRSNLQTKKPPGSNLSLRYVVLPENGCGLGFSKSVIKVLAEALELPFYWTIDNDLKEMKEFDRNSLEWIRCSFARGLLHGQRVLQHCMHKSVSHYSYLERIRDKDKFAGIFPETAEEAKAKVCLLMADQTTHSKLLENISILHGEFTTDMMDNDCKNLEDKKKWHQAKNECIDQIKKYLLKDSFKTIAGVSVGNTSGPGFSLHCSSFFNGVFYQRETNRRLKTYKMVLHNTDAIKELNYLPDSALRACANHNDDFSFSDVEWEHSFLQALDFYGVSNYETLAVYLQSK